MERLVQNEDDTRVETIERAPCSIALLMIIVGKISDCLKAET